MAKSMNLPFDAMATVPVTYTSEFGAALPLPLDVSASSDSPAVAVTMVADSLVLTAMARSGTANVLVTSAGASDMVAVTITAPVGMLSIEADKATFLANPTPPAA